VSFDSVDADSPNHMEISDILILLENVRNINHSNFDILFLELRSSDSSISQMYMLWTPPAFR